MPIVTPASADIPDDRGSPPLHQASNVTEWLPDELMLQIFQHIPNTHSCGAVCRRWRGLWRVVRAARWSEYAAGTRGPRRLVGVKAKLVAVGHNTICTALLSVVKVWHTGGPPGFTKLEGHVGSVDALVIGADGFIYTGGCDATVRVWSPETGQCCRVLSGATKGIAAIVVTDRTVFAGSYDHTIRAWGSSSDTCLCTLAGHTNAIASLAVVGIARTAAMDRGQHPLLCSGSTDGTIRTWDTGALTPGRTLVGHTAAVRAVAAGVEGELVSAGSDNTVRVWNPITGEQLRLLLGHTDTVWCVAVGCDGTLFSGSSDSTIVWGQDGSTDAKVLRLEASVYMVALTSHDSLYALTSRALSVW